MEEQEFINSLKKVSSPRKHRGCSSYGVYDYYKFYRKNKPKGKEYILSESQYFHIIRSINLLLREELYQGNDITFPNKLGKLEVVKYIPKIKLEDGKVIAKLPIDWPRTLKLWFNDEESYNNKTLIRIPEKEIYKIYYNKSTANYNNKIFFKFTVNRDLKKLLKCAIKEDNLDAFLS